MTLRIALAQSLRLGLILVGCPWLTTGAIAQDVTSGTLEVMAGNTKWSVMSADSAQARGLVPGEASIIWSNANKLIKVDGAGYCSMAGLIGAHQYGVDLPKNLRNTDVSEAPTPEQKFLTLAVELRRGLQELEARDATILTRHAFKMYPDALPNVTTLMCVGRSALGYKFYVGLDDTGNPVIDQRTFPRPFITSQGFPEALRSLVRGDKGWWDAGIPPKFQHLKDKDVEYMSLEDVHVIMRSIFENTSIQQAALREVGPPFTAVIMETCGAEWIADISSVGEWRSHCHSTRNASKSRARGAVDSKNPLR